MRGQRRSSTAAMTVERCRIWWPRQELRLEQGPGSARLVLFGWLFTSAGSLDIVVSAAVPQDQILRSFATPDALQVSIDTIFGQESVVRFNVI